MIDYRERRGGKAISKALIKEPRENELWWKLRRLVEKAVCHGRGSMCFGHWIWGKIEHSDGAVGSLRLDRRWEVRTGYPQCRNSSQEMEVISCGWTDDGVRNRNVQRAEDWMGTLWEEEKGEEQDKTKKEQTEEPEENHGIQQMGYV